MALRNEYSFDLAALPTAGVAMLVTEDVGGAGRTGEVIMATGLHTHTDISSVDSDFSVFATALKAALDAGPGTLTGTYTVTWAGPTGYTIVNNQQGVAIDIEFSVGNVTSTAQGTNMRQLLGFNDDQTGQSDGAVGYSSNVRPYYMIIPSIQGRTNYSREKETPDIVNEAVADDGTRVFIAKTTADKIGEWIHVAEIETTPAVFSAAGTPTHKAMVDAGTSANDVPWSWEHSFEHLRTAHHRVLVVDGSDSEVWEVRADGMWFDPTRFSGTDQPLWQIPFKGRKIGAL